MNEYQFDVEETGEGYDLKIFKRHGKSLNKHKVIENFNSLAEVFQYMRHYPLSPSCYIEGMLLERLNQTTQNLTAEEKSFVDDLSKWNKVRKVEVLVTHG